MLSIIFSASISFYPYGRKRIEIAYAGTKFRLLITHKMNKEILQLITHTEGLFNEKRYAEIIALLPVNLLEQLKNAALYEWLARA